MPDEILENILQFTPTVRSAFLSSVSSSYGWQCLIVKKVKFWSITRHLSFSLKQSSLHQVLFAICWSYIILKDHRFYRYRIYLFYLHSFIGKILETTWLKNVQTTRVKNVLHSNPYGLYNAVNSFGKFLETAGCNDLYESASFVGKSTMKMSLECNEVRRLVLHL